MEIEERWVDARLDADTEHGKDERRLYKMYDLLILPRRFPYENE
jgi:hypothetical protein